MRTAQTMRKITISLPGELVAFADAWAEREQSSRSQVIGLILANAKNQNEARLAAEGYQFYAEEATAFAQESGPMTAESWSFEDWTDVAVTEHDDAG